MSIPIADLSIQLQNALDAEYNVTDMAAILQIIAILEKLHITKEQLETTRLGKYINELRRKTIDETLARRSKNLLRQWRKMILPEANSASTAPVPSNIPAKANGAKPMIESKLISPALTTANTSKASLQNDGSIRAFTKTPVTKSNHLNNHNKHIYETHIYDIDPGARTNSTFITNATAQPYKKGHLSESLPSTNSALIADDDATIHRYDIPYSKLTRNARKDSDSPCTMRSTANVTSNVLANDESVGTISSANDANALSANNGGDSSKKKSKKHKKDKKKKKSSKNCPDERTVTPLGIVDNTSSNSVSQFSNISKAINTATNSDPNKYSFFGKFAKECDAVINIDSSSCSNSPKYDAGYSNAISINVDRNAFSAAITKTTSMTSFPNKAKSVSQDVSRPPADFDSNASMMSTTRVEADLALPNTLLTEPKKRGRKRGSKGVDGRIADSNAFSSHTNSVLHHDDTGSLLSLKTKIDSIRGSKKVKTTKELLADLQSRKSTLGGESCGSNYGSKTSSPTLSVGYASQAHSIQRASNIHSVPLPSILSENSEHSHTSLMAGAKSTTATSASFSPGTFSAIVSENIPTTYDFKCRSEQSQSLPMNNEPDLAKISVPEMVRNPIDDEILALKSQLLPIDEEFVNKWHSQELESNVNCTCTVREVECDAPQTEEMATDLPTIDIEPLQSSFVSVVVPKKPLEIVIPDSSKSATNEALDPVPVKKPVVKSIFDLDYDDDEDPIHTFKLNNNVPKNNVTEPSTSERTSLHAYGIENPLSNDSNDQHSSVTDFSVDVRLAPLTEQQPEQNHSETLLMPPSQPPPFDIKPLKLYTIDEDPDCVAKKTFVTSRTSITRFHVQHLHNSCIPNVNGNWDHGTVCSANTDESYNARIEDNKNDEKLPASEEMYARVVPLCNYLTMDVIPKNLKQLYLTKRKRPKKSVSKTSKSPFTRDDVQIDRRANSPEQLSLCSTTQEESVADGIVAAGALVDDEDTRTQCDTTTKAKEHSDTFCSNSPMSTEENAFSPGDSNHENMDNISTDEQQLYYEHGNDCALIAMSESNRDINLDHIDSDIPQSHSSLQMENNSSDLDNKLSKKRKSQIIDEDTQPGVQYKISNDSAECNSVDEISDSNGNISNSSKLVLKLSRQPYPSECDTYDGYNNVYCVDMMEIDPHYSNTQTEYEDDSKNFITLNNYPVVVTSSSASESTSNDDSYNDDIDRYSPDGDIDYIDYGDDPAEDMAMFCNAIIEEGPVINQQMNEDMNDDTNEIGPNICEINPAVAYFMNTDRSSSVLSFSSSCSSYTECTSSSSNSNVHTNRHCFRRHRPDTLACTPSPPLSMGKPDVSAATLESHNENAFVSSILSDVHEEENALEKTDIEQPVVRTSEEKPQIDYRPIPSTSSSLSASRENNNLSSDEEEIDIVETLPADNNELLPSFNHLTEENENGVMTDGVKFKEWYEVVRVKSYNDELLTILPYVVID